jgi:hypothetical protein
MNENNLNELFLQIRKECLQMIDQKRIDISELSFKMGMSIRALYNVLKDKDKDFSVYLKLYEVLLGW